MKKSVRIIAALCFVVLLVGTIALVVTAKPAIESITTGKNIANLTEYDKLNLVLLEDYEDGKTVTKAANNAGGPIFDKAVKSTSGAAIVKNEGKGAPYIYGEPGMTSSDRYVYVNYFNKTSGKLFIQPQVARLNELQNDPGKTPAGGFIMEFDIGCTEDGLDKDGNAISGNPKAISGVDVELHNTSDGYKYGSFSIFEYTSNANGVPTIKAKDGIKNGNGSEILYPNLVEASKRNFTASGTNWIHVTIHITTDGYISVYANSATSSDREGNISRVMIYQSVNKFGNGTSDKADDITTYPCGLRIGNQTLNGSGSFSIDNLLWYQGHQVGDPEYKAHSTDAALFAANVKIMNNTSLDAAVRYASYLDVSTTYISKFSAGVGNYTAEANTTEIRNAVDGYWSFVANYKDSVYLVASSANAATYKTKVQPLYDMYRGIANIADRDTKLLEIEAFYNKNSGVMDRDSDNFRNADSMLTTCRDWLSADKNIRSFNARMKKFTEASERNYIAKMEEHYAIASEWYNDVRAAANNNYADFKTESEKTAIQAAKTTYDNASAAIETANKNQNSKEFARLVALLNEKTPEQWAEDATGIVRKEWYAARTIAFIDKSYADNDTFKNALTSFTSADDYFWSKTQEEHIAVLNAKLETFGKEGANYIEKAGVVTFVKNYFVKYRNEIGWNETTNTVDISFRPKIDLTLSANAEIKTRYEGYQATFEAIWRTNSENESTLGEDKSDYAELLVQNTTSFKRAVDELTAVTSYVDMKAKLEAATVYYLSMNIKGNDEVSDEEVLAAVDAYESIRLKLGKIELAGDLFAEQMKLLKQQIKLGAKGDKNQMFTFFMNCYVNEENLDVTYDKVADYKADYDSYKAEYFADIRLANAESAEAVESLGVTRTFCGVNELVKYVIDLFK